MAVAAAGCRDPRIPLAATRQVSEKEESIHAGVSRVFFFFHELIMIPRAAAKWILHYGKLKTFPSRPSRNPRLPSGTFSAVNPNAVVHPCYIKIGVALSTVQMSPLFDVRVAWHGWILFLFFLDSFFEASLLISREMLGVTIRFQHFLTARQGLFRTAYRL